MGLAGYPDDSIDHIACDECGSGRRLRVYRAVDCPGALMCWR